jgi:hypothetical protein
MSGDHDEFLNGSEPVIPRNAKANGAVGDQDSTPYRNGGNSTAAPAEVEKNRFPVFEAYGARLSKEYKLLTDGSRLHGRFVATVAGRQLCTSREPLLAASRILLAEGGDPETPIATRHAGADFDAMMSTVGAAAGLTVSEGNTRSANFVPYKAFSRPVVEAGVRFDDRPASDTGQGVERRQGSVRC